MLTLTQIKEYYPAEVLARNPKAVLVEYLQYELLDSIFKQKGSEKLSFVGGTAIRIVYHSQRFSEDLDFDNFGLSYKEFQNILEKTALAMEKKGFLIQIRFVSKGAYHCYLKFPGLLAANNLSPRQGEKILIRIDTVNKKRNYQPRVFLLNNLGVYQNILVCPPAIILAQKLITILERKRAKGRDFYDVSYLLGLTKPDYDYLQKVYKFSADQLKAEILKKISHLNLKELAYSVSSFLINPDDQERILSFRQYIEQAL